jgi:hypothetical protein
MRCQSGENDALNSFQDGNHKASGCCNGTDFEHYQDTAHFHALLSVGAGHSASGNPGRGTDPVAAKEEFLDNVFL